MYREQSGYTEQMVRTKLEIERDALEDELAQRDSHFVKKMRRQHGPDIDASDELFEQSDDDIGDDEYEERDFGADDVEFRHTQEQAATDKDRDNDIKAGIMAGYYDFMSNQASLLQVATARAQYVDNLSWFSSRN